MSLTCWTVKCSVIRQCSGTSLATDLMYSFYLDSYKLCNRGLREATLVVFCVCEVVLSNRPIMFLLTELCK
jgi:hypothetical protein